MNALKDGRYPVMLDKERHFCATLNVLAEMEDKCGGIGNLGEFLKGKDSLKNLRWIVTLMLNEGANEGEAELTEKEAGKLINTSNMNAMKTAIFKAFAVGINGVEEHEKDEANEEDGEKNA